MKKASYILTLWLMTVLAIQAQVELRPTVGMNISSLESLKDTASFRSDAGFSVGLDLQFGNRWYVQPGVHYDVSRNTIELHGGEESSLKVGRVRIPVLLGYKLFEPDVDRFFNVRLFTGPNISFVTSVDDGESQLDIDKEDFQSSTFGWHAGGGLDILIVFIDFGYQFGLSDVFDDLQIQGLEGANSKNNVFYLNAGLRVRF